jgi:hypothetical protein
MNTQTDMMYETDEAIDRDYNLRPVDDLLAYFREYARERPEVVALTCFCVGFVLGWRLKPW